MQKKQECKENFAALMIPTKAFLKLDKCIVYTEVPSWERVHSNWLTMYALYTEESYTVVNKSSYWHGQ